MNVYHAKISGTGRYLPEKTVNNFDLEKRIDTSDEWIKTRTGMFERHFIADDEAASDLAYHAGKQAIENAGLKTRDIEMIICATVTGDHPFPSTACLVQKHLGIKNNCPAFDLSAGCTGFVYASSIAKQYIENGIYKNILVIGVEVLSRLIDWEDRSTCVLFGDGAGAVVYSRAESTDVSRFIDSEIYADGSLPELLIVKAGGSRKRPSIETVQNKEHFIRMEGNRVFKLAVKSMYKACDVVLKRNHADVKSIDWILTHQANMRIIASLGKKLKIDGNKVISVIEKYANTSAASIPIALDDVMSSGKVRHGDLVLFAAFGAGLTSGSMLIRI
ncbi:MAG: 3-oxoacyl-ACP synthase [Candidatus Cloacimonadota bacterium]|nr:MAG: 3-oxoacyl-ACP synthase [Candidatus Cloacimonadota bacterium]